MSTSPLFKNLKYCVIVLWNDWLLYQQVFGSPMRISLLNDSGGHLFHVLQQSMLDRFLLGLSRLTDPAATHGKTNLSLEALVEEVRAAGDRVGGELCCQLKQLQESVSNLRKHRNKRIAHADLNALTDPELALDAYSLGDIEAALRAVSTFMNTYELEVNESQTIYEQCILPMGHDGERLIKCLKQAQAFQAAAMAQMVPGDMWKHGEYGDA